MMPRLTERAFRQESSLINRACRFTWLLTLIRRYIRG